MPPVAAPLIIEFHGSSFLRKCTSVQSIVLNMPPHTAKLPAMMGERVFIAIKLPTCVQKKRCYYMHDARRVNRWWFFVPYRSPTETGGRIAEPLDRLKDTAADAAHCEGTAAIVNNPVRARFTGVFLHICWLAGAGSQSSLRQMYCWGQSGEWGAANNGILLI